MEKLEQTHVFQIKLVNIIKILLLRLESLQNSISFTTVGTTSCVAEDPKDDLWTHELNLNSAYERTQERDVDGSDLNDPSWLDFTANNSISNISQDGPPHLTNENERCDTPNVSLEDIVNPKPLEGTSNISDIPSILNDLEPVYCKTSVTPTPPSENSTFNCNLCGKTFKNKVSALRHTKRHIAQETFPSGNGDNKFTQRTSLDDHKLHKDPVTEFCCGTCGKLFLNRKSLNQHVVIHLEEKPFSCGICGRSFAQKVTRDVHVAGHTGDYNFKCNVCGKSYPNKSKLNAHEYTHKEPRFECHICESKFVLKDSLRVHMVIHLEMKPHRCTFCTKTFTTKSNLDRHEQVHKNVKFTCEICDASFKYKSSLATHKKIHSLTEQSNKSVSFYGMVKRRSKKHKSSQGASNEKRHQCNICTKMFLQTAKFKLHMKTHFEEPSFVCAVCGRGFYRKDVYKKHLSVHSGHRHYCCAHCGKAFTFKCNLTVHMNIHTQDSTHTTVCDVCGKKFKHKSSYNIHRKLHLGEFNHICITCGKKFIKKSHYEGHIRSHQTDRPFTCSVCGKDYKEQKHCRDHMRKVHPNDFNLDSLFASITSEDAHMSSLLCSDQAEKLVLEHSQQQQESRIEIEQLKQQHDHHQTSNLSIQASQLQHITSHSSMAGLMLDQPSLLLLDSVQSSSMFSSNPFCGLEPILQDVNLSAQPSNYLSHSLNTHSLTPSVNSLQCPMSIVSNHPQLTVLSGEDTTSVLSQGLDT